MEANCFTSKYIVPHYYEIGSDAFNGLSNWGAEYLAVPQAPGGAYATSPWLNLRPFRLYENGNANDQGDTAHPLYDADHLPILGHPEFNNMFFDCMTEFRDDGGYEWYPDNGDIDEAVNRGTRRLARALTTTLSGAADLPTRFYIFSDQLSEIQQSEATVPILSGSTQVVVQLPRPAHASAGAPPENPNGVYCYDSSGFPVAGTYYNYWVDPMFNFAPLPDKVIGDGLIRLAGDVHGERRLHEFRQHDHLASGGQLHDHGAASRQWSLHGCF